MIAVTMVKPVNGQQGSLDSHSVTPSTVFQVTENILIRVEELRAKMGINYPVEMPLTISEKRPLHVFAKSIELLEKVNYLRMLHGIDTVVIPKIPIVHIRPQDVMTQMSVVLTGLNMVMRAKGIDTNAITDEPFVDGKTPTDVYRNAWRISLMLSQLTFSIPPDFVYRNAQIILEQCRQIADGLGITLKTNMENQPDFTPNIKPLHVAVVACQALHHMRRLEVRLEMDPFELPPFPIGTVIVPGTVYDITNLLSAELVRIKQFLGLTVQHGDHVIPDGKSPGHVYPLMKQAEQTILQLAEREAEL